MDQGETVNLSLSTSDASSGVALVIRDADGAVRTLASNERLLIDTLGGSMASAAVKAIVTGTTTLAVLDVASPYFSSGEEGTAAEVGITPTVTTDAAAQIDLAGTGRIILDGSKAGIHRPAYREPLVA